jgi:plasminogen activator
VSGNKASELFWKIDGAWVIGGTLAVRPLDWLTFRLSGWTPIRSFNAMDDYDWKFSGQDWSDWSHHNDTKMNSAYMFDAGVALKIAAFGKNPVFDSAQIEFLAGYRQLYLSWTAYGGTYVYSDSGVFRGDTGSVPKNEQGISYEQWMKTPYLGFGGTMNVKRWVFAGDVTGSLWVQGRDRDVHYRTTTQDEDRFSNMNMVACNVSVGYFFTERLSLVGRFAYTQYYESNGPATEVNYANGESQYRPGKAAGMDHESTLFSLGLNWKIF